MESVFFAVVYTEGEMTRNEVFSECAENQFSPVFTYTRDNIQWLPLTRDARMATDLAKRNIPRGQVWGILALRYEELQIAEEQGLQPEIFDWPKKLTGRKDSVVSAFPLALPVTPMIKTI